MFIRNILVAVALLGALPVPARALDTADVEHVAAEPKWLALMHYRVHADGWKSEADQGAFFLSPQGVQSPQQELQANLAAIGSDGGAYACRFPARYEWLRARFQLPLAASALGNCPALDAWYAQFPGRRLSISFASSYLENPSSMFGHTFLKVYQESNRELLSPTINYAARTEAREGDLAFIRKGLLGGFPGVADELPFYRRLRTYTENEGRDIWEYALDLTPAEVHELLLHLWEVRDGVFHYYFLDENCAYRTLALIDVVRPQLGLMRHYQALTVPVETIRTLQQAGIAGERILWPAFPKQVRQHEQMLGAADVALAAQIADGRQDAAALDRADPARQAAVLQLAYEYLSVQISRDLAGRETRKATINAILRKRLAQASAGPEYKAGSAPPEHGHEGSALAVGAFRADHGNGASLAWSGFEHLLTDRLAGYEPHAEVSVLHAELRADADSARLHRVDWLRVQSTLPSSALFTRPAWRVALSTERKAYTDGHHVATTLGYSSGRAWTLGDTTLALMPGLALEAGRSGGVAGTMSVMLTRQSALWSAQLEWQAEKIFLGTDVVRSHARATSSLMLSRNMALQLHARRILRPQADTDIGLALKFHLRPLGFAQ